MKEIQELEKLLREEKVKLSFKQREKELEDLRKAYVGKYYIRKEIDGKTPSYQKAIHIIDIRQANEFDKHHLFANTSDLVIHYKQFFFSRTTNPRKDLSVGVAYDRQEHYRRLYTNSSYAHQIFVMISDLVETNADTFHSLYDLGDDINNWILSRMKGKKEPEGFIFE